MKRKNKANQVVVSPNNEFYVEFYYGYVKLVHYESGRTLSEYNIKNVTNASFSNNCKFCVLKSSTGKILVFDLHSLNIFYELDTKEGEGVDPVFDITNKFILDGYWTGKIYVHNLDSKSASVGVDLTGKKITKVSFDSKKDKYFIICMDRVSRNVEFYSSSFENGFLSPFRLHCSQSNNDNSEIMFDYENDVLYEFKVSRNKLVEECIIKHKNTEPNKSIEKFYIHFSKPPLFRVILPYIVYKHQVIINVFNNCVTIHRLDEFKEVYRFETKDEIIINVFITDDRVFILTNNHIFDEELYFNKNHHE
ncbi:MAG: hypothetical protein K9L64_05350 [Candidatus Izimaplasma sp.]|nr:hypothetical protein [Candidatus Izimaplasma bacterium]